MKKLMIVLLALSVIGLSDSLRAKESLTGCKARCAKEWNQCASDCKNTECSMKCKREKETCQKLCAL